MNEERIGLWLRQTKHIGGHLPHRYSVTVNQVMVVTVKRSKWLYFNLTFGSVASLLAAILYEGSRDSNHKTYRDKQNRDKDHLALAAEP